MVTFLSLNVVIDYFSHSCLKMCMIEIRCTIDVTFLDCLGLTFCDIISDLLLELACPALQSRTAFRPTSMLPELFVFHKHTCFICLEIVDLLLQHSPNLCQLCIPAICTEST